VARLLMATAGPPADVDARWLLVHQPPSIQWHVGSTVLLFGVSATSILLFENVSFSLVRLLCTTVRTEIVWCKWYVLEEHFVWILLRSHVQITSTSLPPLYGVLLHIGEYQLRAFVWHASIIITVNKLRLNTCIDSHQWYLSLYRTTIPVLVAVFLIMQPCRCQVGNLARFHH
jgi:hypothetical protein